MGVDVHQRINVVQVVDGQGDVLEDRIRWANNRPETARRARQLAVIAERGGFETIHIAAEATNSYWLLFFCQLATGLALADWPLRLYPFNL